jgi:hypothetical protein
MDFDEITKQFPTGMFAALASYVNYNKRFFDQFIRDDPSGKGGCRIKIKIHSRTREFCVPGFLDTRSFGTSKR